MSRLQTMSAAAIKAFFSPDCDEQVIVLVTLSGANITEPIRIADGYAQRLSETDDDVVYGVVSRGQPFAFLPVEITLPGDEDGAAAVAQLTIRNVTRELTPVMRNLSGPPDVLLEIVLASTPDVIEASFTGFRLAGFTYNASTVSGQLVVDALTAEPFPCHQFTPNWFPGLF